MWMQQDNTEVATAAGVTSPTSRSVLLYTRRSTVVRHRNATLSDRAATG